MSVVNGSYSRYFFDPSDAMLEDIIDILFAVESAFYVIHLAFGIYFIRKVHNLSLIHANLRVLLVSICSAISRFEFMSH